MKVSEWEEGKKWLVAPRPNKKDKDKILKDFYKESTDHWNKQNPNAKKKPMNLLKYIDLVNKNYGDSDIKIKSDAEYERLNPTEASPAQMEGLKKRLDNARAFVTPPKKTKTITKIHNSPIGTIKEIKNVNMAIIYDIFAQKLNTNIENIKTGNNIIVEGKIGF